MKKLPVFLAVIAVLVLPALAMATEEVNGFHSVWLTGGIASGKHASGGFGFRGINFGAEANYVDNGDLKSDDVWVVPGASSMGPSDHLGKKKIDASFGLDFMVIINPIKNISIYGEGGPYYEETQDVYRQQSNGQLWSTKHNYGVTGGGGGGVMARIPLDTFLGFNGLQVSAGYHSIRGVTASFGFTY